MTVIWSGVTEEGAVVPVQVDGAGRVVATTGEPPVPPVIEYNGASAWGIVDRDGVLQNGLNATVTNIGTGTYEVIFTTPMPSADYSVVSNTNEQYNVTVSSYNQTPAGFNFQTISADNAVVTSYGASFAVFSSNALPPMGGTGTDSWGNIAEDGTIKASFNVASASWSSNECTVTFTTPMPTADYAITATAVDPNDRLCWIYEKSATGFKLGGADTAGTGRAAEFSFQVNATNAVLPVTVTAEQLYAVTNNWYLDEEKADGDILTTRYKVEMQEGIKFAGGKAGITRDGELYFTSNGGKYVIAVNDEQIGLTRIDSAY